MNFNFLFAFLSLTVLMVNAQYGRQIGLEDLGKTYYSDVKNSQSIKPCEESPGKAITYCVEDGSKITYTFDNYKLTGIVNLTAFPLKSQAEAEYIKVINEQSKKTGIQPFYSNGMALFNKSNSNISLAFQVIEIGGTYYLANYFTIPF
jgi:hypothetical protein